MTHSTNQQYIDLLFSDLNGSSYGFGMRRLSVNILGTLTERIPFRAYGYKDNKGVLYVGMRMPVSYTHLTLPTKRIV